MYLIGQVTASSMKTKTETRLSVSVVSKFIYLLCFVFVGFYVTKILPHRRQDLLVAESIKILTESKHSKPSSLAH